MKAGVLRSIIILVVVFVQYTTYITYIINVTYATMHYRNYVVTISKILQGRIGPLVLSQKDISILHFSLGTCQPCAKYPQPEAREKEQ